MRFVWTLAVVAVLTTGCASNTRVTLLPPPGSKTSSAVVVTAKQGSTVLSRPYDSAEVRTGAVEEKQLNAQAVQQRYQRLLSAQPAAPNRFVLYFPSGTAELTPELNAQLSTILQDAVKRPGGEIIVTGHTDRVGSVESNDALSLRRARAVRDLIVQMGFDPKLVQAVGRGEREPLVPTDDEVAEPQNRRVEIVVR